MPDGQEEQSVGGGALKGAAGGVSTGAIFGPWGAAIGGVVGAGVGAWQANEANKALKNLQGQPMPQYSMSPEYQDYYNTVKQQAQGGFSPQETAAFKQNVAQQQNTGYRQAVNMSGGNLAQALSAGFGAQNLNSMNQFAGQDAALHRQNIAEWGGAAGGVMGQQNLINQQKIQRRTQLEQAYGGAMQAGLSNVVQGVQSGIGLYGQAKAAGLGRQPNMMGQNQQSASMGGQNDWYNYDPTVSDFAAGGDFYTGQPDVNMTSSQAARARDLSFQGVNQ